MPDPITGALYLGNIQDAHANGKDFEHVVTVCETPTDHTTVQFSVVDGVNSHTNYEKFREAVQYVEGLLQDLPPNPNKEKALIHCHNAVSRSPTVVATAMAMNRHSNLLSAVEQVRGNRPMVNPKDELLTMACIYLENNRDNPHKDGRRYEDRR